MHRIAVLSLLPLLLVGGGGCGQDAAPKADAKAAPEVKAGPDAKAETAPPVPEPQPVPQPVPEPQPQPQPAADDYGGKYCKTIIPCFQSLDFSGSFVADVTVDVEPDGTVSAVSFTGQAPKPVQDCITGAIQRITLDPYNGKPGRVQCKKSGQLMGGTQMIMSDRSYELREGAPALAEGAAPDDAKAK